MDGRAGFIEYRQLDIGNSSYLLPTAGKTLQEYRDIVIAIRFGVAARPLAIKNDTLYAPAVGFLQRLAELCESCIGPGHPCSVCNGFIAHNHGWEEPPRA